MEDIREIFLNILDQIHDVFFRTDTEGRIVLVSKSAARALGWDPETPAVGHYLTEFWYYPEERQAFLQAIRENGSVRNYEVVLRKKDGSQLQTEVNCHFYYDSQGNILGTEGIWRDVSERKISEKAIRDSESKYRSIFESITNPFFVADSLTGQILDLNEAACAEYGYTREEMLGFTNRNLSAEPEKTDVGFKERLSYIPMRYHRRKDGSTFPIEAIMSFYEWQGRNICLASVRDISDRLESEIALKESESKYRSIFEATGSPYFLADVQTGRIIDANQAACRQYGYSYEEILTLKDTDMSVDPSTTERVRVRRLAHVPIRYHKRKDGSTFPVEAHLSYYTWQGRDVIIAAIHDITKRVRYETALRESEARYKGIVESQTDIVLRYDLEGRPNFASDSWFRITGLPIDQPDIDIRKEAVHPEDRQALMDHIERLHMPPHRDNLTIRLKTVNGWRWYGFEGYLIRDDDGTPREGQSVGRDVHDRKIAKEQLETYARRLSVATEAASEAIWEWNILTGELYVSPQAYAILEYPKDVSIDYASTINPDDLNAFSKHVQDHIQGKVDRIDQQYRVTTRTGKQLWIHNRGCVTQRDDSGQPVAVGGTITDVTEARESMEALEQAHANLQKAYTAQKEFLDCVTHEVRTPLIAVKGYADMLIEGFAGPLTEQQLDCLRKIQTSSDSLLGGLTAMLEMSRIKSGKVDVSYEIFAPAKLVSRVVGTMAPMAHQKGLSIQVIDDGCPSAGVTDAKKVTVILTNILSNAIKFTDTGGINVYVESEDCCFTVTVVDTGKGIPDSEVMEIFEDFTQLKTSVKYKETGFGIGLALVAALVDVMDAELMVSSAIGIGSAFTLRIPKLDPSAAAELICGQ